MTPTGIEIEPLTPGSPEWLQTMSASKVAAVMGTSPYDSRFSLWHKMHGDIEPPPQSEAMSRGHYLEPAIRAWFQDQHPGWEVEGGGCWQHHAQAWKTAAPDGLIYDHGRAAVLEVKSASDDTEWGKTGTDEIPLGYRDQVMWQLHVVGVEVAHVAVLLPYLEFREYVIEIDHERVAQLHEATSAFMDSLVAGTRPNLDSHVETYQAVRALHPGIDGTDIEIPRDIAREFCDARNGLKAAKDRDQAAVTGLADYMGACKRAFYDGAKIADRRGANPYLQAANKLPTFTDIEDAA